MKSNSWIKLLFLTVFIGIFLSYCTGHRNGKRVCEQEHKIPDGYVQVSQSFLDSLKTIAEQPPDTVIKKIWISDKPVTQDEPVATFDSTVINPDIPITQYERNLINVGIDAWVQLRVNGHLENFKWGYTPRYLQVSEIVNTKTPVPVIQEKIVKVPQRGLYGGINLGGNTGDVGFGVELFLQQRNGLYYGGQVLSFENQRYYMGKVGFKIF